MWVSHMTGRGPGTSTFCFCFPRLSSREMDGKLSSPHSGMLTSQWLAYPLCHSASPCLYSPAKSCNFPWVLHQLRLTALLTSYDCYNLHVYSVNCSYKAHIKYSKITHYCCYINGKLLLTIPWITHYYSLILGISLSIFRKIPHVDIFLSHNLKDISIFFPKIMKATKC